MKKILTILGAVSLTTMSVTSTVACQSNGGNWDDIPLKPPLVPFEVKGFAGLDFSHVNAQNKEQTLWNLIFKEIKGIFDRSQWNFDDLQQEVIRNDVDITNTKIDFYRNGTYSVKLFVDEDNVITIAKQVTTSNHIADKIRTTDLKNIHDTRPKTILIATIFKNTDIIMELDKFGEFFLGEQTPEGWNRQIYEDDDVVKGKILINKTNQTITIDTQKSEWNEDVDKPEKQYYGTVILTYDLKPINEPSEPNILKTEQDDLGDVPKPTMLQVFMKFITKNLPLINNLEYLSEFLNDVYLIITPTEDEKKYKAEFTAFKESRKKSRFFLGSVVVTFKSN
ncbi:lipoprotein [Spiroplasma chrysopicola]|uniref:Lipoprotein n=1 Tax=Spiroplasma chrysopicola DF-1 TaxID=1276227 RepID=R4U9R1_9MOLU|nr:lipoprotein [Spiroplasma chrysopicola]AGM24604.1 hypothetical protein SCHRY_v1c00170 [Spiroplasma chrysopicola DF-1]